MLFVATTASADAPLKLADIVAVAVRQSPELARARIDVEAAKAQLTQSEGLEDTRLTGQLNAQLVRPPPEDPQGDRDNVSLVLSAIKPLWTGGSLIVQASGQRYDSRVFLRDANGMPIQSSSTKQTSTTVAVGVTQPLLRGRGAGVFEAPIRQAQKQRDAAALSQEARARDLVVQLAQAYWQVAFAWRTLEVRKSSLDLAQKQLAYTEGAIRAEKLSRSDALAVQAAIASRKQDILASEQDLYERSLALRQLGGLEIAPESLTVTTEPLPDAPEAKDLDVATVTRAAFAHSAELASLAAARTAAEVGLTTADNTARSKLDVSVFAGPNGGGRTVRDSFVNGADHPGYEVDATLDFEHSIENRTGKGAQAAARATLQSAKVAERDAQARLAVRATRAVQRAQAALASIALGTEAIGLAEQNVTAEQKRFELGKSTNFEVLRRQDELEQARLRHASAIADYLAARADLDGLSGAILPRYGIVMP